VTAVLATWLGLLVLTRAGRARGASVFATLCLLLVTWSVAIIIQRVTADRAFIQPLVNPVEDVAAFLLPPLTAHIAIAVAFEGRRSATATAVLVVGYVVGVLAGIQAVLDPTHPITFSEPFFEPLGVPGHIVAWGFAAVRFGVWAAGVAYLLLGLREAGGDEARRRQLQYAVATVVLGVTGGMLRILPREVGGPEWVGVSLIAAATVMATYAVVAQHLFIAADVAARAVRWSLGGGLAVVAYVGVLVVADRLVASALRIDLPIVIAIAVVVTIALFDPIAERLRPVLMGSGGDGRRLRLLQAIGHDPILGQAPEEAIEPALARLVRTFELTGAQVEGEDLDVTTGTLDPDDPLSARVPLVVDGVAVGHARFGRKRGGLPFTPADLEALDLAAEYLGSSLRLARRHDAQATALADLRIEHAAVQSQGTALSAALAEAATPSSGLHVYALGPLRAERDGEPIRRWGGAKAGSRQAEAVFAFLFDRGERGAAKDEILEVVWPDVDLDRADVAFHRTMLGLRSVLQPDRRTRGDATGVISFRNDRYRLDPSVIAWSDVAEFEGLLGGGGEGSRGIRGLEQARVLYRGDYLDDCPFYGDSAEVEERRTALRSRYVDLLIELGERYADAGDRPAATACLRDARALADEDLPRITHALERLSGARLQELPAAPEG
jgi:DNA-binding SARP family transcriptional activator